VAKKRQSILVAIFPICLRFNRCSTCTADSAAIAQYVHFALHIWLPRIPQLAVQPDGIINTTSFDPCHPSVVRWIIWWMHRAIVGTTVALTIATCIHPIMVTSCAGGSDTLVAAAVVTSRSLLAVNRRPLYCRLSGVGKYYICQKP